MKLLAKMKVLGAVEVAVVAAVLLALLLTPALTGFSYAQEKAEAKLLVIVKLFTSNGYCYADISKWSDNKITIELVDKQVREHPTPEQISEIDDWVEKLGVNKLVITNGQWFMDPKYNNLKITEN